MAGDLTQARTLVEESAVIDEDLGREVVAAQGRAEMLGRIEMLAGNWTAAARARRIYSPRATRPKPRRFYPASTRD